MVLALLMGGSSFLIWGLVDLLILKIFDEALGFIILGGLMLLSGLFYTFKILAFRCAKTPEERQRILNDIPID